jgi:hypothetical protein
MSKQEKNTSPKIPKLRFREFDDAWQEKKLGDLMSFQS